MIELKNIHKKYQTGETEVHALSGVSLRIKEGEFVSIMGPSGSGKSTIMHIMGLLDTPDSGSYKLLGKEVGGLTEDELAILRRGVIGFVFQQFNLLPRLTAVENVMLPLVYSKNVPDVEKAREILNRLGLEGRTTHRPNQLSIGQQQRVAIARSLINSPRIIMADEPTGNLDSKRAGEIINILRELNKLGMTVIIVTHEEEIGRQANRLIKIRDGKIQSDEMISHSELSLPVNHHASTRVDACNDTTSFLKPSEIWEFFKQGFRSLRANKLRTGLSMLGILIGVSAVVAMLALGRGAQQDIESQLSSLGSNLLILRPGAFHSGGAMLETGAVTRLTLEDIASIEEKIPEVVDASGVVMDRGQVVFADKNWNTQVMGVEPTYEDIHTATPVVGRFFTDAENRGRALVAVVGATIVREIFQDQNPVGEMIKINKINFRVIGVLPEKGGSGWRDRDDVVLLPITTAMHRMFGKNYVDYVEIEVSDASDTDDTEEDIKNLMLTRHSVPPSQKDDAYEIWNMADVQAAVSQSGQTMSFLLASIATISLLVGGIGIMNIMLVSVTERTREIGLRKAIGARRFDILAQFLAESVVISAVGGFLGVAIGWIVIKLIGFAAGWNTIVSIPSIVLALLFSGAIGVMFGLYPARKAALLNPIDALRYE